MTDRARRTLEQLPTPDLWPRIEAGLERIEAEPRGSRPARRNRLVAGIVGALVGIVAISVAWVTVEGHPSPQRSVGTAKPETVQAVFPGGAASCTATLQNPNLQPGEAPTLTYQLTNLADRPLRYGPYYSFPSITDRSGQTLYSWEQQFGGVSVSPSITAPVLSDTLAAGGSVDRSGPMYGANAMPVMRWVGPLDLDLKCPFTIGHRVGGSMNELPGVKLPPLAMNVVAPGHAPTSDVAISSAVNASGGFFDSCRPIHSGVPIVGQIVPPKVSNAPAVVPPPLRARCLATVETEHGADVVTLSFVSPSIDVTIPASPSQPVRLPNRPTVKVVRWLFVVTARSTFSALGPLDYGRTAGPTQFYSHTSSGWTADSAPDCGRGSTYAGGTGVTFPLGGLRCQRG